MRHGAALLPGIRLEDLEDARIEYSGIMRCQSEASESVAAGFSERPVGVEQVHADAIRRSAIDSVMYTDDVPIGTSRMHIALASADTKMSITNNPCHIGARQIAGGQ